MPAHRAAGCSSVSEGMDPVLKTVTSEQSPVPCACPRVLYVYVHVSKRVSTCWLCASGFPVPAPQSGEAERQVGRTAARGQLPLVEVNEVESTSASEQSTHEWRHSRRCHAASLSLSLWLACMCTHLQKKCTTADLFEYGKSCSTSLERKCNLFYYRIFCFRLPEHLLHAVPKYSHLNVNNSQI